jgi:hypothetical protein
MTETIFRVEREADGGLTLHFKPKSIRHIPSTAKGHLKVAEREVLLAIREAIDKAISSTEEKTDIKVE